MFAARFENISPIEGCEAGVAASCTLVVCVGIVHRRSFGGVDEAPKCFQRCLARPTTPLVWLAQASLVFGC